MLDSITDASASVRLARGRYVLGPRLGGGTSSDVYRADDTVLRRPVAVKLFRACEDRTAEDRFRAEALLLAPLTHPALVTVYDTGVEDGRAYQVLQLVEGHTLRDRLADGSLEPSETVRIGARLAAALAYIHRRGIVHRDVKPSNVLQDGEGVYLADFGSSRMVDGAHLTGTGLAIGTAAYMAPEQVRAHKVGPAADVYSLGLLLLECSTGRREYAGSAAEAAIARLSRPPLVPTSLPAPLPSLLAAMTRDDPGQRPSAQTCAAVLRDNAHLLAAAAPDLSVAPDGTPGGAFAIPPPTKVPAPPEDTSTIPDLTCGERRGHWARGRALLVAAAVLVMMLLLGALTLPDSQRHERQTPVRSGPGSTAPTAATPSSTPTDRTSPNAVVPAAPNLSPRLTEPDNADRDPGNGAEKTDNGKKKRLQEDKKPKSDH